jgi:hypothetical protein
MPRKTGKTRKIRKSRKTRKTPNVRGGNRKEYAFNINLFERMKPRFLALVPNDERNRVNTEKLMQTIKTHIQEILADEEYMEYALDGIEPTNNSPQALNELKGYFSGAGIGFDIYEIARAVAVTEDEYTNDLIEDVAHLVAEYIFELPRANMKNVKNAENAYRVMLNASNAMPPNVAAHIASYATGVEPRNNPAYMKNY